MNRYFSQGFLNRAVLLEAFRQLYNLWSTMFWRKITTRKDFFRAFSQHSFAPKKTAKNSCLQSRMFKEQSKILRSWWVVCLAWTRKKFFSFSGNWTTFRFFVCFVCLCLSFILFYIFCRCPNDHCHSTLTLYCGAHHRRHMVILLM